MTFLFGSPNIPVSERGACITYYRKELVLKEFQEREADRYNNILVKYRSVLFFDPAVATNLVPAGRRLHAASKQMLRRRATDFRSVPEAATLLRLLWDETYRLLETWASAQAAALDGAAEGYQPASAYVAMLLSQAETARKDAEREEKRFLKRLRLAPDEMGRLFAIPSVNEDDPEWLQEPSRESAEGADPITARYCRQCGAEIRREGNFCTQCGSPF